MQGWNHGCGPVGIASRFTRKSFIAEVCNKVEDDDAFYRVYRFTVNKMILKYQSEAARTNEQHDETSEREKGIARDTAEI